MTFDGRDPACQSPADRVRACLCEAGYPSPEVEDAGEDPAGCPLVSVSHNSEIPPAVLYQAFVVSRVLRRCWSCWRAGPAGARETCDACTDWSPPRELLLEHTA